MIAWSESILYSLKKAFIVRQKASEWCLKLTTFMLVSDTLDLQTMGGNASSVASSLIADHLFVSIYLGQVLYGLTRAIKNLVEMV